MISPMTKVILMFIVLVSSAAAGGLPTTSRADAANENSVNLIASEELDLSALAPAGELSSSYDNESAQGLMYPHDHLDFHHRHHNEQMVRRIACYARHPHGYSVQAIGWDEWQTQNRALHKCGSYACYALGCRYVYVRRGD